MLSRLFFEIAYRVGFTPWDRGIPPPELIQAIEGADALPSARALDVGCGTGTESIYLAEHGWKVVGVDFAARPLVQARSKAAAAGVAVDFRQGDAARLGELGLGTGYQLLFDKGCFHGLSAAAREGYSAGATAAAAPGALFLLFAFSERPRAVVGPPGILETEVRAAFSDGFEIVEMEHGRGPGGPRWYHMRRRGGSRLDSPSLNNRLGTQP